jgi:hypothetical protein
MEFGWGLFKFEDAGVLLLGLGQQYRLQKANDV